MSKVVVFDTNILISAIGWKGTPYFCVELARQGIIESVTCQEILDELVEKLQVKLKFPDRYIIETIADLISFSRIIKINKTLKVIENDPDDDVILECGIIGKANYIITGDKKHLLPLKNYQGITIINATEFKNLIS
ncbi:putative toxin-antitoxin system toxin component, PIN family [Crocosphaera sp. XPORK-15E]|uniref:putative toxin-antitoxin system toxin component, PIN family n=1 Tax=Crocosphaera sp. XPORK-15E TaxID=3110247 RepID=UPI002B1EBF40|nr:putative toxin-antitoxin system toxin component, PIN family [Crocosphaera sp. XPORK-15E]MEA5534346.1 putative toxin-antitoxin system toxin component, PIN family [Crocosphaera sp. XPORK-15E]